MTRIGFYGFGNMATAIVSSWKNHTDIDISFYRRHPEKVTTHFPLVRYKHPSELVQTSDYLFLGFKPQHLNEISTSLLNENLSSTIVVSLLAGTSINTLERKLPHAKGYVRMMPNTSMTYQEGATGIYFGNTLTEQEKQYILILMSPTGLVLPVTDESLIDTITGISGSGPAFIYLLAHEILTLDARYGLSTQERKKLFAQTLIGAGKTLLHSDKDPLQLIKEIASPNGTTEAGLNELQKRHFSSSFSEGTIAAITRAKELGDSK